MTINEMHIAFKLMLDKTSGLVNPVFLGEEIDFWLNRGIEKFVKTRYSGLNTKGESFEQTQKRTDDLRTLVVEETLESPNLVVGVVGVNKPNSFIADLTALSETYWFTLGEEVTVEFVPFGGVSLTPYRFGITECTIDSYRTKIDDPFSEHVLHYNEAKPLRLFYGDSVELITDGNYDVTKYYIRYLRQPVEVVLETPISCDLPVHTHEEIVKLAVSMVLENIEQQRYQTQMAEVASME